MALIHQTPRVTVVITQRERMSLTERSLESILSDQTEPFHLIYVSAGAPEEVNTYLLRRKEEVGFTLILHSSWMWPNVARNLAMVHVQTPYAVFIDNDVVVEPGWLHQLVKCADETQAALVGPLYLWSDGITEPKIHMSGGSISRVETPHGTALHERHVDINEPLAHRASLKRAPCDFLEYHCMLVRSDFVRSLGGLSESIVCIHEHIDIAVAAHERGQAIFFEPAAAVTYLAFVPYLLSDVAFYRWRWRPAAAEESIKRFCEKWDVVDHDDAFTSVRHFVHSHATALDLFLPDMAGRQRTRPLAATDIAQNLFSLLNQAASMQYDQTVLANLSLACDAAMAMFGGGFRPCSRPFVTHCTGTASALLAFGFAPHVVIAGMLHAAYSHAPVGPPDQSHARMTNLVEQIRTLFGSRVERLISAFRRFQTHPSAWLAAHPVDTLSTLDAEVAVIAVANSIDECAAGEPFFSNKPGPDASLLAYAQALSASLGIPAFAQTLSELAHPPSAPLGTTLRKQVSESYFIQDGQLIAMAHNAYESWQRALINA